MRRKTTGRLLLVGAAAGALVLPVPAGGQAARLSPRMGAPVYAVTGPATGITASSATLTGMVGGYFSFGASCDFEYGPSAAYGATAPCASVQSPSVTVSGLSAGTTYHYRLDASATINGSSFVSDGSDATFTTATPPQNTSPPVISGSGTVGHRLSATTGVWSGTEPLAYSYLWERCTPVCASIARANGASYRLTTGDVGVMVRVLVTASNSGGSGQAPSTEVGPVHPNPAQIKALLLAHLVPSGGAAKLAALVRNGGYAFAFRALSGGRVAIGWYYLPNGATLSKPKAKPTPVLVAAGKASFAKAGPVRITIKLTALGKQILGSATTIQLTAEGTYMPTATPGVVATKTFTLTR